MASIASKRRREQSALCAATGGVSPRCCPLASSGWGIAGVLCVRALHAERGGGLSVSDTLRVTLGFGSSFRALPLVLGRLVRVRSVFWFIGL